MIIIVIIIIVIIIMIVIIIQIIIVMMIMIIQRFFRMVENDYDCIDENSLDIGDENVKMSTNQK